MKFLNRFYIICVMLLCVSLVSCDNDGNSLDGESIKSLSKKLVGVWYCTYQEWAEDGYADSKSYDPSEEYFMAFDIDGTGTMHSGRDELFEIGTHGTIYEFEWNIYNKNNAKYLHTTVYDGNDYKINEITNSKLRMTWVDGDYKIVCEFVKQN